MTDTIASADDAAALPDVELLHVADPFDWARQRPEKVIGTLEIATRGVPSPVLSFGDYLSHAWLRATGNPWRDLIRSLGDVLNRPGIALMNLCYEWGCTTAAQDVRGRPSMARTVDWPFVGLGRFVAVAIERTPHGPVAFVTWPGFVGAVTAFAPGRFAVAINKAPLPILLRSLKVDRTAAALRAFFGGGLPITHLVREAVLESADFATVVNKLATARRVTTPGLVVACGVSAGEAVVVERFRAHSVVHRGQDGAVCVANDWLTPGLTGWPPSKGETPEQRVQDCSLRVDALRRGFPADPADFAWVTAPVLNNNTRAALYCCPAEGRLAVRGFDLLGAGLPVPATRILDLALREDTARLQ
jgi:hypothetical protein